MDLGRAMVVHGTVVLFVLVAATAMSLSTHTTEAQVFFDTIPEEEKSYFVSYSLAKALYEEEAHNGSVIKPNRLHLRSTSSDINIPKDVHIPEQLWYKFEEMDYPEDFPANMFSWLQRDYNMQEENVEELLLRQCYCFPDNHCVDMGDIGNGMDYPAKFPEDMYSWVCKDYKMKEDNVEELLLRQYYCFPDGHCVDMDDIGNTCCPF